MFGASPSDKDPRGAVGVAGAGAGTGPGAAVGPGSRVAAAGARAWLAEGSEVPAKEHPVYACYFRKVLYACYWQFYYSD